MKWGEGENYIKGKPIKFIQFLSTNENGIKIIFLALSSYSSFQGILEMKQALMIHLYKNNRANHMNRFYKRANNLIQLFSSLMVQLDPGITSSMSGERNTLC